MTTTTPTDTAAALEAAIDDYGNATAREAMNADERAALSSAITAHLEAEVARRLAAAPEVEAAIVDYAHAVQSDFDAHEERDTLRAAIAADKARAVAEAQDGSLEAERFAAAVCRRVGARETGTGGQQVTAGPLYADAAKRIDRMLARDKARPTPDEARRLVEAYGDAEADCADGDDKHKPRRDAARVALLRALGVEA